MTEPRSNDDDGQPCSSCERPTGNPDTFCDACKLDELETDCDRLRAALAAERARAEGLLATVDEWRGYVDETVQLRERVAQAEAELGAVELERDAERAKAARVLALCAENDGGLNESHLVQLVEYIRVAAGGSTEGDSGG